MKSSIPSLILLLLIAAGPTATEPSTGATTLPTADELKDFAESLCTPIDKMVDASFKKSTNDVYVTFHDKVSVLSFDLEKTDSILHPVAATIVLRIYVKIIEANASIDCTDLITAKVAKADGAWVALSCTSIVEDEQTTPAGFDTPDAGKTTNYGAPWLQKIIDSIGTDAAKAKAAQAAFRRASADLTVACHRATDAESKLKIATEKCLASLHSTDQYKALKSKMDQAQLDKKQAESDSNWQARLDADSVYNRSRLQIENMETSAIATDPAVTDAKRELDAANEAVDQIIQRIRDGPPDKLPPGEPLN